MADKFYLKSEYKPTGDQPEAGFAQAQRDLTAFLGGKGVTGLEIALSDQPPQADAVSGKFKHILKKEWKSAD